MNTPSNCSFCGGGPCHADSNGNLNFHPFDKETRPMTETRVLDINVSEIRPPEWNSRVVASPEDDESLASSVKASGVRTPIRVREISPAEQDGTATRYILVYGSRRLQAARTVGLATIPASVDPATPAMAGTSHAMAAMMDNAVENLSRKDLSPFEQARTFAELRKAGWKLDDVVKKTGVSKSHISNLATIYTMVDPVILTKWAEGTGKNPAATTTYLRSISGLEKSQQLEAYAAREVQLSEDRSGGTGDSGDEPEDEPEEEEEVTSPDRPAPPKKYAVLKGRVDQLLKRLKATKQPVICTQVVNYLIGKTEEIPGVIGPPEAGGEKVLKKTKK